MERNTRALAKKFIMCGFIVVRESPPTTHVINEDGLVLRVTANNIPE